MSNQFMKLNGRIRYRQLPQGDENFSCCPSTRVYARFCEKLHLPVVDTTTPATTDSQLLHQKLEPEVPTTTTSKDGKFLRSQSTQLEVSSSGVYESFASYARRFGVKNNPSLAVNIIL